ncbi:MAG: organic hydroperoxide resistance protein [Bacteroidia bacterium]|nr:organic hydroperoxide resistance protein [Bacteroidia bacterium]
MKPLYTAEATATGGREGHVRSSDGILDLDVRIPREMGGPGGQTNPEQLFAAGYSACFDSALNHVARMKKIKTGTTTVTAEVTIGSLDNGGFGLSAKLHAHIPGVTQEVAEELIQAAHQVCPYSNATRNNIQVDLSVSI